MSEHFATECIEKIDAGFIEEARTFSIEKSKGNYWKKLFFKYGIITVGMALLLIFSLLYPPRKYEIRKENGNYWVEIDPEYAPQKVPNPNLIRHDSVQEMEQAFRRGSFTVQEFRILGSYASGTALRIFNLDNLMEPTFPDGFDYYVEFTPDYYSFHATKGDTQVSIKFSGPHYHDSQPAFENTVRIPVDIPNANSLRDKAFQTNVSEGNYNCYYIIVLEDFDYYVTELYRSEYSDTKPYKIFIHATPHNPHQQCLIIDITNLAEWPDVFWLAQFGCRPH